MTAPSEPKLRALVGSAEALTATAFEQASATKNAIQQLLEVGARTSAASSEGVGALLGGAIGIAVGISVAIAATATAPLIPFLGAIGMGAGVLMARGRKGIAADRIRRDADLNFQQGIQFATALRAEARAAIADGASPEMLSGIWTAYGKTLESLRPRLVLPTGTNANTT